MEADNFPSIGEAGFQSFTLSILVIAFIFGFALSFAVGANDSANSFGCSVGSNAMSLRTACILGTLAEIFGAVFLSGNVIKKITQGIVDINYYTSYYTEATNGTEGYWTPPGNQTLLPEVEEMIGSTSVLLGSASWQLFASWLAWPVSGTHSIIGGILGFHFAARGIMGIDWVEFGKIVVSWFASPLLSGVICGIIYWPIRRFIIVPENSLKYGKIVYPFIWAAAILLNVGVIFTTGSLFSELFGGKDTPWSDGIMWALSVGIAAAVGVVVAVGVYGGIIKLLDNTVNDSNQSVNKAFDENEDKVEIEKLPQTENDKEKPLAEYDLKDEDDKTCRNMFVPLQWLAAVSGSLGHGGNDVGNCIGPLVTVWLIYQNPISWISEPAPWYILFYGGAGIAIGLWFLGWRVIKTIGTNLSTMSPSRGFVCDFSAAVVVLLASKLGIPVSTTHCQVGAVIFCGMVRALDDFIDFEEKQKSWATLKTEINKRVDFRLFGTIGLSWVITVPAAGITSAICYMLLFYIYFIIVGYNGLDCLKVYLP